MESSLYFLCKFFRLLINWIAMHDKQNCSVLLRLEMAFEWQNIINVTTSKEFDINISEQDVSSVASLIVDDG